MAWRDGGRSGARRSPERRRCERPHCHSPWHAGERGHEHVCEHARGHRRRSGVVTLRLHRGAFPGRPERPEPGRLVVGRWPGGGLCGHRPRHPSGHLHRRHRPRMVHPADAEERGDGVHDSPDVGAGPGARWTRSLRSRRLLDESRAITGLAGPPGGPRPRLRRRHSQQARYLSVPPHDRPSLPRVRAARGQRAVRGRRWPHW